MTVDTKAIRARAHRLTTPSGSPCGLVQLTTADFDAVLAEVDALRAGITQALVCLSMDDGLPSDVEAAEHVLRAAIDLPEGP
jgi:hypothetical protein